MAESTKQRYARYERAHEAAHRAGLRAGDEHNPTPMVVAEAQGLTDQPRPNGKRWHVPEGVCGFAWITVRPGNSSLANYLKREGLAQKAYRGGVSIWVSAFGQSYERKMKYARAYAEKLSELPEVQSGDVRVWPGGRLD